MVYLSCLVLPSGTPQFQTSLNCYPQPGRLTSNTDTVRALFGRGAATLAS